MILKADKQKYKRPVKTKVKPLDGRKSNDRKLINSKLKVLTYEY